MYYKHADWLTVSEAMVRLTCSRQAVQRLCRAGKIGTLSVPGSLTKLSRADVERLAQESLRPSLQRGA